MNVSDLDFDRIADDEFEAARRGERAVLVIVRCAASGCRVVAGRIYDTAVGPMAVRDKHLGSGLAPVLAHLMAEVLPDEDRRARPKLHEDTSFYVFTDGAVLHFGLAPGHRRPGLVHMGETRTITARCDRHGSRTAEIGDASRAIRKARMSGNRTTMSA